MLWGNDSSFDNIVWGNSGDDNIVWGNSSGDEDAMFGDDTAEVNSFDPAIWEGLFEVPVFTNTSAGGVQ